MRSTIITPGRTALVAVACLVAVLVVGSLLRLTGPEPALVDEATVERGSMVVRLTEVGTLRAAESFTYRSPLEGREIEVVFLAPEGLRVGEGDLILRLDPSSVERDLERAEQALRQAELDERIAEGEAREAQAAAALTGEAGDSFDVEEAAITAALATRRLDRATREYDDLAPLLEPGYITREELDRAEIEREQAAAAARLAARRLETLRRFVQPREQQRSLVQLSQSDARMQHARHRVEEARRQVQTLREAIDACSVYARGGGLVVYEDHVSAMPRRKVRVGDRVTPSQGLVTIPEVSRMLVHASIREGDVHRVRTGAPASVKVDAFPALVLEGRVVSIGTLARTANDRPVEDKRFDLIVDLAVTPAELRPEMTARVEVHLSERADVVLVPINAVFERDGEPVVHVVSRQGVQSRRVTLGQTNELYYEVVSGLEAGERVRLSDVLPSGRLLNARAVTALALRGLR